MRKYSDNVDQDITEYFQFNIVKILKIIINKTD